MICGALTWIPVDRGMWRATVYGVKTVRYDLAQHIAPESKASQGALVKNPPVNGEDARNASSISGSGRSSREDNGNPLQYSCQENPMDRGACRTTVYGAKKSQARLNDWAPPEYKVSGVREYCANLELGETWVCLCISVEPSVAVPIQSHCSKR